MNGVISAAAVRPAGFWIRAVAAVLDFLVIAAVQVSLRAIATRRWGGLDESAAFHAAVIFHTLLFTAVYTVVLHAATGQTVGKMLVGIRVVATDGGSVPVGAALLRYVGYYASLATLTVGFLMAGLRSDKRALHDLLADTRVERRPRVRAVAPPAAA